MHGETGQRETEQIAPGLRRRDIVVLQQLVEQYQYRLVRYLIYHGLRGDLVCLLALVSGLADRGAGVSMLSYR
jgi:hypothetical protein